MEVKKDNAGSPSWSQLFAGFIILIIVGIFGTFIAFFLMRIPTGVTGMSLGARNRAAEEDNSMTPNQCYLNETFGMENWATEEFLQPPRENIHAASISFFGENPYKKSSNPNKESLKNNIYKIVCTDSSIHPINKPADLVLGYSDDVQPISCIHERSSLLCKRDLKTYENFNLKAQSTHRFEDIKRNMYSIQMTEVTNTIKKEIISLSSLLKTDEQIHAYIRLGTTLITLRTSYLTSQYIDNNKDKAVLVCTDINLLAAFKLLKDQFERGTPMKLQLVGVSFTRNNRIEDHAYALLDSNCNDVTINNDQNQVKKILENITGDICDPWNTGTYQRYETDDTGYYKNAPWSSLRIQTLSLNLNDFDILPEEIQNYFCQALFDIGFDIHFRNATSSRCRTMK